MNIDGWEKDSDAPWRRWCIDDPRRGIISSFPVAIVSIRPIITPASIAVTVISTPSMLVTAVVMSSTLMVIFAEGRHHVYAADHGG
jgi:hypothetical protein